MTFFVGGGVSKITKSSSARYFRFTIRHDKDKIMTHYVLINHSKLHYLYYIIIVRFYIIQHCFLLIINHK